MYVYMSTCVNMFVCIYVCRFHVRTFVLGMSMPGPPELRVARDGLPYSWAEFQDWYSPSVAWAYWQDSAPFASGAAQPAVEAHDASRAVHLALQQPTLEDCAPLASGAAQPAAETHGASTALQQPTLEDSAPCASGAAQLAVEAPGASRAVQSAPQQPTLECFTFELRWPSGALIQRYEGLPDESIERLTQDMDEGLIEGIPPAETTADGEWLQSYHLLWGQQVLRDGQWLSELGLPPDATITVILEPHQA